MCGMSLDAAVKHRMHPQCKMDIQFGKPTWLQDDVGKEKSWLEVAYAVLLCVIVVAR